MFQCAFLFSAFLDFSTREKISGRSLVFISTHTYCSDAGRLLLKFAQILPHGFDLRPGFGSAPPAVAGPPGSDKAFNSERFRESKPN